MVKSRDLVHRLSKTFLALEISGPFTHSSGGHVNFARFVGACTLIR